MRIHVNVSASLVIDGEGDREGDTIALVVGWSGTRAWLRLHAGSDTCLV